MMNTNRDREARIISHEEEETCKSLKFNHKPRNMTQNTCKHLGCEKNDAVGAWLCVGVACAKICGFDKYVVAGGILSSKGAPKLKMLMMVLGAPSPYDNAKENKAPMPGTQRKSGPTLNGTRATTPPCILLHDFEPVGSIIFSCCSYFRGLRVQSCDERKTGQSCSNYRPQGGGSVQVVEIRPQAKEDDTIFKRNSQSTNKAKGHPLCQRRYTNASTLQL